jgi:hypothetical protein
MAKQNPTPKSPAAKQVPFRGYIRCDIARTERMDFEDWVKRLEPLEVFNLLLKLADSGYRVGFGAKGDDLMASLSNQDGPSETRGYVLTAFGSTAEQACQAVLYKHYVKLSQDWGSGEDEDDFHVR